MAVYGITIDFAAVSGDAESELTRNLLDEFGVTLLPTENPFTIIFVRTVHGLALEDLDSMRRYAEEMQHLRPAARAVVELIPSRGQDGGDALYGLGRLDPLPVIPRTPTLPVQEGTQERTSPPISSPASSTASSTAEAGASSSRLSLPASTDEN